MATKATRTFANKSGEKMERVVYLFPAEDQMTEQLEQAMDFAEVLYRAYEATEPPCPEPGRESGRTRGEMQPIYFAALKTLDSVACARYGIDDLDLFEAYKMALQYREAMLDNPYRNEATGEWLHPLDHPVTVVVELPATTGGLSACVYYEQPDEAKATEEALV